MSRSRCGWLRCNLCRGGRFYGSRSSGFCNRGFQFRFSSRLRSLLARTRAFLEAHLQAKSVRRNRRFLLLCRSGSGRIRFRSCRPLEILVAGILLLFFGSGSILDFSKVCHIQFGHMGTNCNACIAEQLHHHINLQSMSICPILRFHLRFIRHE